jgi:probable F420-dependent oxidoreductase
VALLEAGPSDAHPYVHMPRALAKLMKDPRRVWIYRTAPEPATAMAAEDWGRGRMLGGSSSINGMGYVRGQPADFEALAELTSEDWSWRHIGCAYAELERHELGAAAMRGGSGGAAEIIRRGCARSRRAASSAAPFPVIAASKPEGETSPQKAQVGGRPVKLGFSANLLWNGVPITELAPHAEALGFESIWTGEHIVIPVEIADPVRHGTPLPDAYRHMPDPFIWFAAAAAATKRIRFGLDVCLAAQRNPLVLAKQAASLDQVSKGRLIFGVGAGWIAEEAPIFGYAFKDRARRTYEHVRALKTLWTEEKPSFRGEFVNFPPVYSYPKPWQKPHPPILIGAGNHNTDNRRVLQRVAEIGDGWVPAFLSPAQMREQLGELKRLCAARGRDFAALDITLLAPGITLGVGERPSFFSHEANTRPAGELIAEYEEAGVGRIIVGLPDMEADRGMKILENAARGLGLA